MLGPFALPLILLLLAKEFDGTDGFPFRIRRWGQLEACVSSKSTVFFTKMYPGITTELAKVEVVNTDGTTFDEFNCNLVLKDGCKNWNLTKWKMEMNTENSFDRFPAVTDYRWNDLPVVLSEGKFLAEEKTSFSEKLKMHYSILANESAQLLLSDDPNLKSGINLVIDGWHDDHSNPRRSSFRNCKNVSDFERRGLVQSATCEEQEYGGQRNQNIFNAWKKWVHATIDVNSRVQKNEIKSNENGTINIRMFPIRPQQNYLSFRTNYKGLFKLHKYRILQSTGASSTMTLIMEKDLTSTLCVDVLFLTDRNLSGKKLFSVEIFDANKTTKEQFKYKAKVAYNANWATKRFESRQLILKKDWTVKLTAHVESLVIGGVRFCSKDLIVKPKVTYPEDCHFLENEVPTTDTEQAYFDNLLVELGECEAFGGNCARYQLCKNNHSECSCFAGFDGSDCSNKCQGSNYGVDCRSTVPSNQKCADNEFSRANGRCRDCVEGFIYPDCTERIPTVTPVLKHTTFDAIVLDLSTGFENVKYVLIQYKKFTESRWENKTNIDPRGYREYTLRGLQPRTNYNIRYAIFDGEMEVISKNKLPGPDLRTSTKCRPIEENHFSLQNTNNSLVLVNARPYEEYCTLNHLRVLNNKMETVYNGAVKNTAHPIPILSSCSCGEVFNFQLTVEDSAPLRYNFTCTICTTPSIDHRLIAFTGVPAAIVVILSGLAFWFYFKRRRNSQSDKQNMIEMSDNPKASTPPEENIYEGSYAVPFNSQSAEISAYLKSALTKNFLKEQFKKVPRGQTQPWECGSKPENKNKNRYRNLTAYDSSRVVLEILPGDDNSDYINANYVDGYKRPKAYIASQGPLPNTINDFWRMVWQEKTSLIVMLTNLVEEDKVKCEKYWPDLRQELKYGHISVRTKQEEMNADFVSRTLSIACLGAKREVRQLHYTNWPNHGVPLYPQSIAIFIEKIMEHNSKWPILIHCSAGVGRTGTVILIDACLRMISEHGQLDVQTIFSQMRSQRVNLVDNSAQFEFAHLVLMERILNPKFEIGCDNFEEEYKKLMANKYLLIKENYAKLEEICDKDFQRVDSLIKNEPSKCRYPEIKSSLSLAVWLFPSEQAASMNFINAVFVDGYKKTKQFIVTQVPMSNTIADFWRMIDQYNIREIIVLNEPSNSDADFVPTKDRKLHLGQLGVELEHFQKEKGVLQLNICLTAMGNQKRVQVKCASGWTAMKDAPPNLDSLIELWGSLKAADDKESIAVVCHDGVTASGLFLGIGFVIEKIKMEHKIDVGLAVRTLRKSKPAFISTENQLRLLYEAARKYLTSLDDYQNFK